MHKLITLGLMAPALLIASAVGAALAADEPCGLADAERVGTVRTLYLALLDRDPVPADCAGLRSWVESPVSLADVRRGIMENREYHRSEGPPPSWLLRTDPSKGELPEGIAAGRDALFVTLAPTGQVLRVSYTGQASPFSQLPQAGPGQVLALGLAVHPSQDLYVALWSQVPEVTSGVYRIAAAGGEPALFATHPDLKLPNDLAFDKAGSLFITDSLSGAVYRRTPQGEMSRWVQHPLLEAQLGSCPADNLPLPVGVNGLAFQSDGSLLAVNSSKATIVRVSVNANGSAGAAEVFAGPDCKRLLGADGIALDSAGAAYVGANIINRITKVSPTKQVTVIESGGSLDFPATLAFGAGPYNRNLYIANFGLLSPGTSWAPYSGVLSKDVGVTGKPLP